MNQFTEKQISQISCELYDWVSDKDGDDLIFREAGISLIALGLQTVLFKTNKAGQINKSEAKKLMSRLIISIDHYNRSSGNAIPAEVIYSRLPDKTQDFIYTYVMTSLMATGSADLLADIVCKHVNNNVIKESDKEKHIGEIRIMNCGQTATIIGWYKGKIVIRFEDGTMVGNKRYYDFKKGRIMNPALMDLTGYRFHNFEVIEPSESSDKHRNKLWYCRCACGNMVELSRAQILGRCGCPKSCGCKK